MRALSRPASSAPGWWLPAVVALGLALNLPSLGLGFWADDYVHQLVLDGQLETTHLRPSSLYDFGDASDWQGLGEDTATRIWWTSPDWKIRFLRPLRASCCGPNMPCSAAGRPGTTS